MMKHYEDLANAIIVQATVDYGIAVQFLKQHPHTPYLDTKEAKKDPEKRKRRRQIIKVENERDDIERFFLSIWFETLSKLDGEILLEKVKKMVVR